MAFDSVLLGEFIELVDVRNSDLAYGVDDVRGVNNQKLMIRTKADLSARDLSKFQVVQPGEFFFNHRTSRNGDKFSVTFNYDEKAHIVTEDYVVFRVVDEEKLNPLWLYLYLCRTEFDRYVIQNSWGSSTEFYNWEDLCQVSFNLPSIEIQRKYSAIYSGILENQRCYENSLSGMKTVCDLELDKLKDPSIPKASLGDYIDEVDVRNSEGICEMAYGINLSKEFMPSVASSDDLLKYKLVMPGQIACNLLHVGRDASYPIAVNDGDSPIAVSPAYFVFKVREGLDSKYLMSWFSRDEVGRNGWFICDDSIRGSLSIDRFTDIKIPMPPIELQKSLGMLRSSYKSRWQLNKKLKEQLRELCPILIKGSLEEAAS